MPGETKYYELSYLISPSISQDEATAMEEELRVLLGGYETTIDSWDSPKPRRLAYPIKDETEAYMGALRFTMSPKHSLNLTHALDNKKKLLRTFFVEWKKAPPRRYPKITRPIQKEEQVPTDEKALDEKLNEIFGTPTDTNAKPETIL